MQPKELHFNKLLHASSSSQASSYPLVRTSLSIKLVSVTSNPLLFHHYFPGQPRRLLHNPLSPYLIRPRMHKTNLPSSLATKAASCISRLTLCTNTTGPNSNLMRKLCDITLKFSTAALSLTNPQSNIVSQLQSVNAEVAAHGVESPPCPSPPTSQSSKRTAHYCLNVQLDQSPSKPLILSRPANGSAFHR